LDADAGGTEVSEQLPTEGESTAWKVAFQEYTGQWAFVLSLSRRMVFFLRIIRDGQYWDDPCPGVNHPRNQFIVGTGTLERRGLIKAIYKTEKFKGEDVTRLANWELTPAGELVCELMVLAGLMPAAVKKQRRRAA
jgi:hypothetical protein